ncbi:hypothetical protein J6590_002483 [Homalodisca vitripennis]|nr:hypothetical protein J6590_002483 [Homalodisca vitripennis]
MQESEVEGRKNGAVGMSRLELSAPVISGIVLSQTPPHPQTEVKVERLVDNVIAESRRPFSWCIALLYFRVLPLHFSKHKNSTKTNIYQTKLLLQKHSKLVFILDHIPPPKMRVPPAISAGFGSTDEMMSTKEKHPSR